jgi:ABC-type proline/glycine betaine transport system permease subunit
MLPVLSLIGHGIGFLPAVIAVLLYSQLPIIRSTSRPGRDPDRRPGDHGRHPHRASCSTSASPPSRQLIAGALAVSLLAIAADYGVAATSSRQLPC